MTKNFDNLPVILVDSREQTPLIFTHLTTKVCTLTTGDYSILGMKNDFSVERKSMPDLLGSVTNDHDRIMREMDRMRGYQNRELMAIGTPDYLHQLLSRRKVTLASVLGSLAAIEARGIPVKFYRTPEEAALHIECQAVYAWRNHLKDIAKVEIPDWARLDMQRRIQAVGFTRGYGKEVGE